MSIKTQSKTPDLNLIKSTSHAKILQELRIKHTRIKQVMIELGCLIYPGSQDSILMVCGPSGAGKSTLAKHMVSGEIERSAREMEIDAGIIRRSMLKPEPLGKMNSRGDCSIKACWSSWKPAWTCPNTSTVSTL